MYYSTPNKNYQRHKENMFCVSSLEFIVYSFSFLLKKPTSIHYEINLENLNIRFMIKIKHETVL